MQIFFFLLSILIFQPTLPLVYAQTADQLRADVDALSLQIKALDDEIEAYNSKIQNTQGEAKTLRQALANLEARRAVLSKEISRTLLKIKSAKEKISDTESKIFITKKTIERNSEALEEILRRLHQDEEMTSPILETLTKGAKLSDGLDLIEKSSSVSKEITARVRDLKGSKDELEVTKVAYETSKKQLENLNETLADQKSTVEQTSSEKAKLLTVTKNKESEYQKLLSERQKKKQRLEQELSDVESKLKVFVDASKLPKYGKGVLKWPVPKVTITQYFGNTPFASQNPQVYNGFGHNGVDFAVPVGTPILSAQSGIVVGTGDTDKQCSGVSYGKWVLIKHSNGLTTLYAHLSRIDVSSGNAVVALQKIGLSGNTGYSTGPHLHFTVYASDSVHVSGPTEYKSKVCGTYMIMPLAPRAGYLNPLSYL
ncbi:MAG: Peptidase protein [Patescibacteria group bacterium]|nr:Peptidase protein [Patescibacteria group bacterium]